MDSVPGASSSLPQPSDVTAQPAAADKPFAKPPKPSKASKVPKAVELPPEAFQREEPFETPAAAQKVILLLHAIIRLWA